MSQVKEIMTEFPECCTPETSLKDAAKSMCDTSCGALPVIDENKKPIGVITDRDITCRSVAQGKNPLDMKVRDAMTSTCVTIDLLASVEECCEKMEDHQIRRIPVIDKSGQCCGMVAQADIALAASQAKTAEVLQEISKC